MKRTFGRFMSLLLVFAMVLAMVPAVFAADTVILKGTKYLAPYQTLEINYETERTNAGSPGTNRTYFTGNITRWTNSDRSLIDMTVGTDNKSVTLKHRGGTGRATITAYYKDDKQKEQTAATWTVTITDWTMKLSPSNPNSSSPYTLTTNDSVTLTATVTGVNDWLKASDTKVRFTSSSTSIAKVNNQTDAVSQGLYVTKDGTNTSTAESYVTINAGTGNGTTAIIAELGKETTTGTGENVQKSWEPYTDTNGDPIRMEFWVKLGGSAEYEIRFSNDELSGDVVADRIMTVSYNTTNKKITPVLYKNGSPVNSRTDTITYTYTSSWEDLVHIDPDGTVLLQDSNKTRVGSALITVGAKLNGNVLTGTTAQCTVTVIKKAADGVSIDYTSQTTKLAMQNGTYVFGYKDKDNDGTSFTFSNGNKIATALNLSATVDSENKSSDVDRV